MHPASSCSSCLHRLLINLSPLPRSAASQRASSESGTERTFGTVASYAPPTAPGSSAPSSVTWAELPSARRASVRSDGSASSQQPPSRLRHGSGVDH